MGNCCEGCCGPRPGPNDVVVLQEGCCVKNFNPETPPPPLLQAGVSHEDFRAAMNAANSKFKTLSLMAFVGFFLLLAVAVCTAIPIGVQFEHPGFDCVAPNGVCVAGVEPWEGDCCQFWCCNQNEMPALPDNVLNPDRSHASDFRSVGCWDVGFQKDKNCDCYEVGNNDKNKQKFCFSTRIEGGFTENPGKSWPRAVMLAILAILVPIAYVWIFYNLLRRLPKAMLACVEPLEKKANARARYIQGGKHRPAAFVFTLPQPAAHYQPHPAHGQPPAVAPGMPYQQPGGYPTPTPPQGGGAWGGAPPPQQQMYGAQPGHPQPPPPPGYQYGSGVNGSTV